MGAHYKFLQPKRNLKILYNSYLLPQSHPWPHPIPSPWFADWFNPLFEKVHRKMFQYLSFFAVTTFGLRRPSRPWPCSLSSASGRKSLTRQWPSGTMRISRKPVSWMRIHSGILVAKSPCFLLVEPKSWGGFAPKFAYFKLLTSKSYISPPLLFLLNIHHNQRASRLKWDMFVGSRLAAIELRASHSWCNEPDHHRQGHPLLHFSYPCSTGLFFTDGQQLGLNSWPDT